MSSLNWYHFSHFSASRYLCFCEKHAAVLREITYGLLYDLPIRLRPLSQIHLSVTWRLAIFHLTGYIYPLPIGYKTEIESNLLVCSCFW